MCSFIAAFCTRILRDLWEMNGINCFIVVAPIFLIQFSFFLDTICCFIE